MSHRLLLVCAATTALGLASHRGLSAGPPSEEPEPRQKSQPPIEGLPMPTMGGMQFWADELSFLQQGYFGSRE